MIRGTKPGLFALIFAILLAITGSARAQNPAWFQARHRARRRQKPRLAVADFVPREDATKTTPSYSPRSCETTLASQRHPRTRQPEFLPHTVPQRPRRAEEPRLDRQPGQRQPGRVRKSHRILCRSRHSSLALRRQAPPIPRRSSVRSIAARPPTPKFANSRISLPTKLSAGSPAGFPASPRLKSPSSVRAPALKEIWVMDYDGANQRPLTSLHTISLTPRWSPDASRIAFTCFAPAHGVVSPQICMYSDGRQ